MEVRDKGVVETGAGRDRRYTGLVDCKPLERYYEEYGKGGLEGSDQAMLKKEEARQQRDKISAQHALAQGRVQELERMAGDAEMMLQVFQACAHGVWVLAVWML